VTNELEYYGRPEPRAHSVVRQPIQLPAGDKPARDEHFYQLFEGDAVRLAKTSGLRAGASFLALAVHAGRTSLNRCTCYPKVPTAAQLTGQSTRATSGHFRGLDDDGFIKARRRRRTSSVYTVAHSDSSKQRYAQISKPWLEAHRGAGASALFLLAVLLAMAGPRRTFSRRLDDLLRALGVPRSTFYRLAGKLKRRGWMDWRCADGLIELTMLVLENPVSKTTVLAVSKTAVLAVSKTAHEVDKNLEVARGSEEARSEPKSRSTPDQRRAQNRALAAAPGPVLSPSQDQEPPKPPAAVETVEACIERMLAKIGVKLTLPPEPEPKPKVKSAVQLLREEGWIITTDGGWPCAEKPGEHNCDGGLIFARDERGHESTLRCKVCLDAKRQAQPVEQAEPAATHTRSGGFNVMEMSSDIFGDMIAAALRPRLPVFVTPQLPGRTIEAECSERKPPNAGDVLPPKMYADCRKWIGVNTDTRPELWSGETSRQINKMLRWSGVARYGAEALRVELAEARRERWMTNHGHCHDGPCDGTRGHACDECDGMVMDVTDKGVLDPLGCAIYALTGDEHYGRNDSGCPNAVHERMYAA
jgi:hypothetical protein